MTMVIAALVLLSLPLFVALLNQNPRKRPWALIAIGLVPFMTDLPVTGYFYGWTSWSGISRGFAISPVDTLAAALILTRGRTRGTLPFWGLFAFYAVPLVLSVFASSVWLATVFIWWQLGRSLLLFAAVGGEVHRREMRDGLLAGLALGLLYQAGHVIPQKLSGVVQAPGTLPHQNILGLMIEQSIIPLTAALMAGNRRKIVFFGIVAGLICIAGSGSRGTMGIAGGSVLFLMILSLIRRTTPGKTKIVGLTVLVILAATPLAIMTLEKRFGGASVVTEESERKAFERAASKIASDFPIGTGANMYVFISNSRGYADAEGIAWQIGNRSVPVHNAYMLARAETGWWGEIAFILLLVVPAISGLYFAFSDRKSPGGEVALGGAVALIANMVHNNYEFATHTFDVQSVVIINVAVIAALIRERRMEKRTRRKAKAVVPGGRVPPVAAPARA